MVISSIVYAVSPTPFLTDILAVAAAVLPVAAAGYTYLQVKEKGKEGTVWLLLCIGYFMAGRRDIIVLIRKSNPELYGKAYEMKW